MASFTLTNVQKFPNGTVVGAYPVSGWRDDQLPPSGAALGSATNSQTMTSGTLTFTGLTAGVDYFAGKADGTLGYVRFTAAADQAVTQKIEHGPSSSTAGNVATYADTTGESLSDSGKAHSTDGTFASNSDAKVPTEKAVKTYSDTTKQPITLTGTLSARPAAAAGNANVFYFATDDNGGTVYRSDGATWTKIAASVTTTVGQIDYASTTTQKTSTSTVTGNDAWAGLSVTDSVGGRPIIVEAFCCAAWNGTSGDGASFHIYEGSTKLATATMVAGPP